MHVDVSEYGMVVIIGSVMLWRCISKSWLRELKFPWAIAKFMVRDKPPPRKRK